MPNSIDMATIDSTRTRILKQYPPTPPLGLKKEKPSLNPRATGVLASIHNHPFLGVDVRASLLDMSSPMLRRTIASLEAQGWLQQVQCSRKTRGYIRYFNITDAGLQTANLEMPGAGTGSFFHRKCQAFLKRQLKKTGIRAEIEFLLRGKRADVGYIDSDKYVALEVGLSSADNELTNILKDSAAGFHEIRMLLRDSNMVERVEQLLNATKPKVKAAVNLELLTDHLDEHANTEPDED